MNTRLVLLCLLCAAGLTSCIWSPDVLCICNAGGQSKTTDLGKQHNPSVPANTARCDTIAAYNGWDSCRIQILR